MGIVFLIPAWAGLIYVLVLDQGVWLVLLMILCVVCADVGAYFSGRRWGRRKLAPSVSPGKTWEGFAGGDRKSTRLNSSHVATSYAVFCFEKKNGVFLLLVCALSR